MVARLNSFTSSGYGRFAVVVGDPENREPSVVFGTQNQADDVEVREIEQASDVEIDGGVSVVNADAVVEERLGAEQSGSWNAASFFEEGEPIRGKISDGNICKEEWAILHAVHTHQLPLW